MSSIKQQRIFFLINPVSGKDDRDWKHIIHEFFSGSGHSIQLFELDEKCKKEEIENKLTAFKADKLVAVGGDGTIKLAAEILLGKKDILLGIIPAGSANGLAKELMIPLEIEAALENCVNGMEKPIHLVKVNDHLCIHLSDIGFNAHLIKIFEKSEQRGMWGYIKAAWKTLGQHDKMTALIKTNSEEVKREAAMIVVANATKYGSGALINPDGDLSDYSFEVIVIRKISFREIFKMLVTHQDYNPQKTEVFQCSDLKINSRKMAHFQVDGEYLGKVKKIDASIIHDALKIIIPAASYN